MKEGCRTSQIPQDWTILLFSCARTSRQGKKDLRDNPEITEAASSTTGPGGMGPVSKVATTLVSKVRITVRQSYGDVTPTSYLKVGLPPQWAQRESHQAKEGHSQALRSNGVCLARFRTCLGRITPFYLPISLFWNAYLSIILEKHITYLLSQVHRRGILPQDVLYLESYPYLTQMLFR